MTITSTIERARNLTRLTVVGDVTVPEMRETIEQFWEAEELTLDVLWDYTEASMERLTNVDLQNLVPVGKRYGDRFAERRGGRTAIVAPGDLEFGMMRVSQTLSGMSGYPFEVRVFRTMGEAESWLAEDRRREGIR